MRFVPVSFLFGLLAFGCCLSADEITYDYTGNFFNPCPEACAGDSSANFISASLTFADPLAPNQDEVNDMSSVISWSMTDNGSNTLSSALGDVLVEVVLSTDSAGDIVPNWSVQAETQTSGPSIYLLTNAFLPANDQGPIDAILSYPEGGEDSNYDVPGTWTTVASSNAPEPLTPVLAFIGGATLIGLGRWRYRKLSRFERISCKEVKK